MPPSDGSRYCGIHSGMPAHHTFRDGSCIYCPTPDPNTRTRTRPTREETFFMLAQVFALRGSCDRAHVGCVIVRDSHVLSHGYNGTPSGMPHCNHEGDDRPCEDAVHAEANAIAYAARVGVNLKDTTMYSTHGPCVRCAQLIIQAGITRVSYITPYRLHAGVGLLLDAGIDAFQFDPPVEVFKIQPKSYGSGDFFP